MLLFLIDSKHYYTNRMPLDSRNFNHALRDSSEVRESLEDSLKTTLEKAYRYYWGEGLSHFFYRKGGGSQHVRSFTQERNSKLLIISPGRGESSLKYSEICLELKSAGFDIVVVDHRGQGFSERLARVGNCGHIDDFGVYAEDLKSVCDHFKEKKEKSGKGYKKTLLLAHSMGSAAAIVTQAEHGDFCDGMILSSPMVKIQVPKIPFLVAKMILKFLNMSSLKFKPVRANDSIETPKEFLGNILTQSEERFSFFKYIEKRHPQVKCGPPTFSWLGEAVTVTRKLIGAAPSLNIPILVMQAEDDDLVCNKAQDKFVHRLKNGRVIRLKESKHEILQERSSIRNRAFVQIHKFLKEI